jgi:hypothetical protein
MLIGLKLYCVCPMQCLKHLQSAWLQPFRHWNTQVRQTMRPRPSLHPPAPATSCGPQTPQQPLPPPGCSTSAAGGSPAELAAAAAAVSPAMGRLLGRLTPSDAQDASPASAAAIVAASTSSGAAPSLWGSSMEAEVAEAGGFRLSLSELSASEEVAATALFEVPHPVSTTAPAHRRSLDMHRGVSFHWSAILNAVVCRPVAAIQHALACRRTCSNAPAACGCGQS